MRTGVLLFLLMLSMGIASTWAEDIVLVADPWSPFNNQPGGDRERYLVDVARMVFEPAGHTVIYKTVPWKRAIEGTRTGRYTGAIGASKTAAAGCSRFLTGTGCVTGNSTALVYKRVKRKPS